MASSELAGSAQLRLQFEGRRIYSQRRSSSNELPSFVMNSLTATLLFVEFRGGSVAHFVQQGVGGKPAMLTGGLAGRT